MGGSRCSCLFDNQCPYWTDYWSILKPSSSTQCDHVGSQGSSIARGWADVTPLKHGSPKVPRTLVSRDQLKLRSGRRELPSVRVFLVSMLLTALQGSDREEFMLCPVAMLQLEWMTGRVRASTVSLPATPTMGRPISSARLISHQLICGWFPTRRAVLDSHA